MERNTTEDEFEYLRVEFAKVDIDDAESVIDWFSKHSYLSCNQHAIVANRSAWWIRKLKRRYHIKNKMPKVLPVPVGKRHKPKLIVPKDWDNKEWLEETLKTYSMHDIARATGRSSLYIFKAVKRYGIKHKTYLESVRSKNKYCTEKWCREHYEILQLSQKECARLAGISVPNFANWLNRFKINIRDPKCKTGEIWVKILNKKLLALNIVRAIYNRDDRIHVRFKSGSWESYYFGDVDISKYSKSYKITRKNSVLSKIPRVSLEYESDIDQSEIYEAHISINKHEMARASLIEKRIAIHEMAWCIIRRGRLWPKYPEKVLEEELYNLQELLNKNKYISKNAINMYPHGGPYHGLKISNHFFGVDDLYDIIMGKPKRLIWFINNLAKKKDKISFHNILREAYRSYKSRDKYRTRRMYDLVAYAHLFRDLNIKGTLLDLYPNDGYCAIACALMGLKYSTIVTEKFQRAIDNGFLDFVGLKFEPYVGQNVDCVLCNNNFLKTDINESLKYADKTKRIISFVKREDKTLIASQIRPEKIIRISTMRSRQPLDYFFIF